MLNRRDKEKMIERYMEELFADAFAEEQCILSIKP